MTHYTFRLVHDHRDIRIFECAKWGDDREPLDVYIISKRKRSANCNCYARGPCKHIELVKELIDSNLEHEAQFLIWSYDDTWQPVGDMLEEA